MRARTLAEFIRLGEWLEEKRQTVEGSWSAWLAENTDISEANARRAMRLARGKHHLPDDVPSVNAALKIVKRKRSTRGKPGPLGLPSSMREEALRLRAEGWTFMAVAEHLGVSHTAVERWEKPIDEARAHDRQRAQAVRDRQPFRHYATINCAVCGRILDREHLRPENWHREGERLAQAQVRESMEYEPDYRRTVDWRLSHTRSA